MTLPDASVNLSPITLFQAPSSRASWYNNITWSGRANVHRATRDLLQVPGAPVALGQLDTGSLTGSVSSSFSIGNLNWGQSLGFDRASTFGFPVDSLPGQLGATQVLGYSPSGRPLVAEVAGPGWNDGYLPLAPLPRNPDSIPRQDLKRDRLQWSTSLGYQQTLVGSTTLTPNLTISGSALRSDTVDVAHSFVSTPSRVSFGADLKSDIYGFFGGFGPFSAIRHKMSPSISYQWSPEKTPTPLQRRVFGNGTALHPVNQVSLTLNQTFEAKRKVATPADSVATARLTTPEGQAAVAQEAADTGAAPPAAATAPGDTTAAGPRRAQQQPIANLLSIRTSAIRYDFVEADSAGGALLGFQTTRLDNAISSDFLRGLSVQMSHDLFRDSTLTDGAGKRHTQRSFAPHLAQLNLGFSLNNRSTIFKALGLFQQNQQAQAPGTADLPEDEEPFPSRAATDESTIIPGEAEEQTPAPQPGANASKVGQWNANFSYALSRPRDNVRPASQMLQISFNLVPTDHWNLAWRTSYDLERGAFNDHMVSLTRDLHRWQATFDFQQTATGNWAFRFQVSLLDNRDLKFNYDQRSSQGLAQGGR